MRRNHRSIQLWIASIRKKENTSCEVSRCMLEDHTKRRTSTSRMDTIILNKRGNLSIEKDAIRKTANAESKEIIFVPRGLKYQMTAPCRYLLTWNLKAIVELIFRHS
ncbi:hypothetical protein MKW98_025254 [Papaver atlanticum]|uniref:Uncharacterized protein n=1 Tax=Papaver atlanticum TaxID=357466 RepID=A0AAD4S229_9MAGN|nr:hypothetical protein MKW98_025254 [Papaver atlanticum]